MLNVQCIVQLFLNITVRIKCSFALSNRLRLNETISSMIKYLFAVYKENKVIAWILKCVIYFVHCHRNIVPLFPGRLSSDEFDSELSCEYRAVSAASRDRVLIKLALFTSSGAVQLRMKCVWVAVAPNIYLPTIHPYSVKAVFNVIHRFYTCCNASIVFLK